MKPFTITSPTNALAVGIYAMLAFAGLSFVIGLGKVPSMAFDWNESVDDMWSMLLFISASAAVYATLTAPKRRDPDTSLMIEFWACISLCTLMVIFESSLLPYRTPAGNFMTTSFGFGLIFLVAFGFRARQIKRERKAVRDFRNGSAPR